MSDERRLPPAYFLEQMRADLAKTRDRLCACGVEREQCAEHRTDQAGEQHA